VLVVRPVSLKGFAGTLLSVFGNWLEDMVGGGVP